MLHSKNTDRLQQAKGAQRIGVGGVFGRTERYRDVALCCQIINFGRAHLLDNMDQVRCVGQVTIMQREAGVLDMGIAVDILNPAGVER